MRRPKGERVSLSKPLLFKMIGYEIYTSEVARMHASSARVKIMSAPARTSKSYSAAADVLSDCFPDFWHAEDGQIYPMPLPNSQHTRLIWIVAPDYKLAKEFDYLYSWLVDQRGKFGFGYKLEKAQNSPDQGAMKISIDWGKDWTGTPIRTVIEGKSSTNEKSLQAEEVYRVILSEAADQDERVWAKYLSTRYGAALFPTTPKVKADWIRKMIEQGAENPRLKVESFDYDGRCNPSYDWERYWIEHAKAESRQVAPETTRAQNEAVPPSLANGHDCFDIGEHCYASRDPHFAEQFMGRWTYAESRVLSFRWKALGKRISHVLEHLPEWVQHADKYVSMDYGYTDPAAAAYFAVHHDGTVIMVHEIYQPGLTPEEFAQRVLEVPREKGWRIKQFLSDPRKPEVLRHFQRLGVACMRVDKNRQSDRQAGFMAIQDYLSDDPILGRPKLFISRHCPNAINEMKLLRRKDNHAGDEFSTAAIAGEDHLCFVAGTMISTEHGDRPIESVRRGDRVWTRVGLRRIVAAMETGTRETITVHFSNGTELRGTPDHPIWTENRGFVPMDGLRYSDICATRALSTTDAATTKTTEARICGIMADSYIGSSGSGNAETYQMGTTFTTSTAIPRTTPSRILNACRQTFTDLFLSAYGMDAWSTWLTSVQWPQSGTAPMLAAHGTPSILARSGKTGSQPFLFASGATLSTKPSIVAGLASVVMRARPALDSIPAWMMKIASALSAAARFARTDTSRSIPARESVEPRAIERSEPATVYNLSVADVHEYFANGILVSNCDSLRYFLTVFPRADSPETKAKVDDMARVFEMARQNTIIAARLRPRTSYVTANGGVPGLIH